MTPEHSENPAEAPLDSFRAEIEALQKSQPTEDLRRLNPAELTRDDHLMWQRVKGFIAGSNDLPQQEFYTYHQNKAGASSKPSRVNFAAFLANKLYVARGKRQLEQEDAEARDDSA